MTKRRTLGKKEIIERLKQGEYIGWIGGLNPCAFMGEDTVRWDTLLKLEREEIIPKFGYPNLHGKLKLKEQ